ncbi:unnamed protein product [Gadus morhua 'NCC']
MLTNRMDKHIGPPLPFASLRLLLSPVRLVSGAIWHTVQHHLVSDYGMLEEFVSMVTDIVPELLSIEQKTQLLLGLRARNGIPGEFGCSYDDQALVNVTWQFLSRLEKLFPLQTIQQVALMLADIPSALEECLKSVSHRGELQTLLGCRKGLLDKNGCPLDGARETSALHLCVGDRIKAEKGHQARSLPDVHRCGSQIEGPHASTAVAMSEDMEAAVEKEAVEGMSSQEFMDAFGKDCLVLLKRLEDVPAVQRRALQIEPDEVALALYQCDGCEKSFKYRIQLNKHKLVHSQLYCEICERVVRDAETLARHKVSHKPFQCTLCEKNFGIFKHLASHCKNVHQLSKPYECHHCPKVFSKFNIFIGHEWQHTGQLPFQCSQCSMTFKQDAELAIHLRVHTHEKPFLCKDCGKRYACNSNLTRHSRMVHNESSKVQRFLGFRRSKEGARQKPHQKKRQMRQTPGPCKYKLALDGHKRTHNQLYCEVCRRVLRDAETLARHKVSHTPFQCTLCEKDFGNFKQLSRHYESTHKLSKPYKCHHCPKVFSKLGFYIRHEWKHTGQLPFQCSHCAMKFKQDTDLAGHLRVHTHEKPYLCTDCGKTFSSSSNLCRHVKFRHSESREIRRFTCTQCSKTFKEKGALQKHEQRKHQNHKKVRHPCTYCGKMFSQSWMAGHQMIHTGEKPLKCHILGCDQRFRSTSGLKNHSLLHHTAERPFECNTCGKGFIRASILKQHMEIHTGEKNHVCLVCGKAFRKAYSMARHVKLVHSPK